MDPTVTGPPTPTDPGARAGSWTAAELDTLAALAETFVRGAARRRARLAADALDLAVDPAQVRQLRLALRLLESRPANLVLAGRPVRFSDLDPAGRERYLLAWGTSRLGLRRSAFQAFRRLLSFLAYADPGADGTGNPHLATIGYIPDDPPLTAEPTPIGPWTPPSVGGADHAIELDADVVVVGSGAGGGVIAKALAEAGRSVLVLEAGPFVPEPEMPRDELDAFDRLYLDHGMTATWDGAVSILAGAGVGGGTTVNWGTSIRPPDAVRAEWAREHGIERIDGSEADDDLVAIEAEVGVTPVAAPPPKDQALLRGAAELGLEAGPLPRDAPACTACGSCPFGCRAGAKRSGLRAHLADADRAGARVVPAARVDRVIFADGRAAGVEATLDWEPPSARALAEGAVARPPRRIVVRARQVVLAAGPLRTPAILERSGIEHGELGRNLRLHPVAAIAAWYPEPIDMWRGPNQGAASTAHRDPAPGRNAYIVESAPGHPGLLALALPWEGTDRHAEVMRRSRWCGPLIAVTRDGGAGRVRGTRTGGVRIDYSLDADGVATLRHALATMAAIARAAGARSIVAAATPPRWHGSEGFAPGGEARAFSVFQARLGRMDFGPNRATVLSAHQMGTVRMGADRRTHPCDPEGRVRAGDRPASGTVRGLYVADTSLFPTGLGVNPMLTVMALARRVSRTVLTDT